MRVISKKTLQACWEKHPDSESAFGAWFYEAEHANWKTPQDVLEQYPTAENLKDNRVKFKIKGNDFRLVVKIHYNTGIVYIRFAGTHAEYDKINAETI
jgi:mRNA interferase HigB